MMKDNKTYIHYGSDKFDSNKFLPIVNQDHDWTKPKQGGLWASAVGAEYGWKEWCIGNEMFQGCLKKSFTFDLSPSARVCHLRSVNDLKKLPKLPHIVQSSYYKVDFEKAMEEYDAIEIHLSDEVTDNFEQGLYFRLYGWDCDSILIMNPDIIKENIK